MGRLAAIAFALLCGATGVQAQTRSLQSVDFVALDANRVLVTLSLSGPAPQPTVFSVDKPARLSLDLPDTKLALAERFRKINVGEIRSYAAAEASGRTRVVLELTDLVTNSVRVDGDKVLVELNGGAAAGASAAASAAAPVAAYSAPAAAAASISSIDFRRGEAGEGRVVVTLSDPHTPVDVEEQGGKIVAKFRGASLPAKLARRLDVLDFATPVKFVDALADGTSTQIVVTPAAGGDYDQVSYQNGGEFTLELQPMSQAKIEERRRNDPVYTGERISLSFQSVDVRSLLQIIADVAGTNMVISDSVQGTLAMRLQNVPWDQALDIILRTRGLGMRHEGNVMLIAPTEELAQRGKVEAEAEKLKVQLAPLRSEIIQVNYAKATDIAALLKGSGSSLLSERGRVTVDDRTNTLLVLETRDKLNDIRVLIERLDIPVRQVLIESRIVIATDNFDKELGTRFGVSAVQKNGSNGLVTTTGTGNGTSTVVNSYLANGGAFPVNLPAQTDQYNVNLPVGSPAGSIGMALLGSDYLVDLELSALQSEGRGEVISAPRVTTANAKQAEIEQGVEIPYSEASSSGATSVSFKKAVLSLDVTPQITPDERIIMDLTINKDSVGQTVATANGGSVPSINTNKVRTQVLVNNGQTVVLGGIYQRSSTDTIKKVPLLGDIPVLGFLFKTTIKNDQKGELLIFITPKILSEGLQVKTN